MQAVGQNLLTHLYALHDASSSSTQQQTSGHISDSTKHTLESSSVTRFVETWLPLLETAVKQSTVLSVKSLAATATPVDRSLFREVEQGARLVHALIADLQLLR